MTLIELLVALLILVVGILATFAVFSSAQHTTHVSEILEGQNHIAQRELERIQSLAYGQVAIQCGGSGQPSCHQTSTDPLSPEYWVSGSGCSTSFQWDQSQPLGTANTADLLAMNGCSGPGGLTVSGGTVAPIDSTTYPGYTVYDFVTWSNDPSCGPNSVAGTCQITDSYKRVTVEVTAAQVSARLTPTRPVLVSAVIADPKVHPNVQLNTNTPLVTCDPVVPASVPCNYGLNGQTANLFYLTDSPEQSGIQTTGTTTSGVNTVTLASTANVEPGMLISGPGIPSGTKVSAVNTTTAVVTMTQNATAAGSNVQIAIGPYSGSQSGNTNTNVYTGTATLNSSTIAGMSSTTGIQGPTAGQTLGMYVLGTGTNASDIPSGTYVTAVSSSAGSITLSQPAAGTGSVTLLIGPYQPRQGDNSCMHYTTQARPLNSDGSLNCGGTPSQSPLQCSSGVSSSSSASPQVTPNACARPDLLFPAPAPSAVTSEYNFSPAPGGMSPSGSQGRTLQHDPNATGSSEGAACSVPPSQDATKSEFWATQPLSQSLSLSGFGGMTLYTQTSNGTSSAVTLCVGLYLEQPVTTAIGSILDPLNSLCGNGCTSDTTPLGAVAYTVPQWPGTIQPLSFSFYYPPSSETTPINVPQGDSIGVRLWVTNDSGDVVVYYDSPSTPSDVEIDSQ